MNSPELRAITAKAEAEVRALIRLEEGIMNQYRTKGTAVVEGKEGVLDQYRAKGYTIEEV